MADTGKEMHILFTADENYVVRIPVVLQSVYVTDPGITVNVHLISDRISGSLLSHLSSFCKGKNYTFSFYEVPEDLFAGALVNKHYSKAMYYRLLAADILPEDLDRVLYLDPDVLVINSLLPLWDTDLGEHWFAAASHTQEEGIIDNINRLRLETSSVYFNTGVLLMDLEKCRKHVKKEDVFSFVRENGHKLLLPDQDVFNALYGSRTKQVPDEIWNYDARKYSQYMLKSGGEYDEYRVIRNTAVIHYCGKGKPWNARYRYRFGNLYRHYEWLSDRDGAC